MSTTQRVALMGAVAIQALALTAAVPSFHVWLAGAIGAADAIIAVTCFEVGRCAD